jgi:hypothetical protein
MTAISTCPDEHELLRVATGEPAGEAIARHLGACPICAGHVDLLRADVAVMPHELGEQVKPPSTEPGPAVDLGDEPMGGGTTVSCPSGPAGAAGPGPIGPEAVAAARARAESRPEIPVAIGKYMVVRAPNAWVAHVRAIGSLPARSTCE